MTISLRCHDLSPTPLLVNNRCGTSPPVYASQSLSLFSVRDRWRLLLSHKSLPPWSQTYPLQLPEGSVSERFMAWRPPIFTDAGHLQLHRWSQLPFFSCVVRVPMQPLSVRQVPGKSGLGLCLTHRLAFFGAILYCWFTSVSNIIINSIIVGT